VASGADHRRSAEDEAGARARAARVLASLQLRGQHGEFQQEQMTLLIAHGGVNKVILTGLARIARLGPAS
jgi:hypothetical protein